MSQLSCLFNSDPPAPVPPGECADGLTLRIITVNDIYELANMARLKTCIVEQSTEHTIVVCPGDFVAPSLMSAIDKGYAMVDLMNKCGIQYVCIGNHEANIAMPDMLKRYDESKFKWINTNMPDVDMAGRPPMPEYEIVEIEGAGMKKKIGLLGLDTNIMTQFPQKAFGGAKILDPLECAKKYAELLADKVDCIVPLTHLDMKDDRALARLDLGFPIALGGHDHDLYHEIVKGQHILKVGQDATHIGIVDITWKQGSKKPIVNVQVHDSHTYTPDPEVAKCIAEHEELVTALQSSNLTPFPVGVHMSSLGIRTKATTMGTFMCTSAREAMKADCCVNRSGYIRGSYDYVGQPYFTYADLIRETPLDLAMVVIMVPGQVIADTVKFSRTGARIGSGDFLQVDNAMIYDEPTETLTHIAGQPVVPDKSYALAFPYLALKGTLAPLMAWVKEHPDEIPTSEENGIPIQVALVEYWSAAIWLQLAKLENLDADDDGQISIAEIKAGLAQLYPSQRMQDIILTNILAAADTDGDGTISKEEILRCAVKCADWTMYDIDGNATINRKEFQSALAELLGVQLTLDEEMLNKLFDKIDTNGDGELQQSEVRHWIALNRANSIGITGVGQADLLVCW